MKKIIKLMPDYYCYPLWWAVGSGQAGDIDPSTLPLKPETIQKLMAWSDTYDDILNEEDPAASGFTSQAEEDRFEEEGIRLWFQLREELASEYDVGYMSQRLGKYLSEPSELKTFNIPLKIK
jgi:hypothetical protein